MKLLPRNRVLASFQFDQTSPVSSSHFGLFPRAISTIIESTSTRELHLRFSQGWWDQLSWGSLPSNGSRTGGTGVELWAVIEASDLHAARLQWFRLAKSLAGYFCASLNFVNDPITTLPRHAAQAVDSYALLPGNNLYYLRAALPAEPVCTENLTPFIKLLPTRGKAGLASLLDGHKIFDLLWHSMAIDYTTTCSASGCRLQLAQSVNTVFDVERSIRTHKHGPIFKPVDGEELVCDEINHTADAWLCFPVDDSSNINWSLETIFGRNILGPAFHNDQHRSSSIILQTSPDWELLFDHDINGRHTVSELDSNSGGGGTSAARMFLEKDGTFNVRLSTRNSSSVSSPVQPPVRVARSLTGYSQDHGGFRIALANPSPTDAVEFVYFESLPWFLRLYLHTNKVELKNASGTFTYDNARDSIWHKQSLDVSQYITDQYYRPARDRARPSHLELVVRLPSNLLLVMTYEFDKSLLLYHEYPPDANHGFAIDPAIISVLRDGKVTYELRTASLLVTLPTPDFSMPYNVIILTCTVMSLAFGSLFNLLTKKVVTEKEMEKVVAVSLLARVKKNLRSRMARAKAMIRGG